MPLSHKLVCAYILSPVIICVLGHTVKVYGAMSIVFTRETNIRCTIEASPFFPAIFIKPENFFDFFFASCGKKTCPKRVLHLKIKRISTREKNLHDRGRQKLKWQNFSPWKCSYLPYKRKHLLPWQMNSFYCWHYSEMKDLLLKSWEKFPSVRTETNISYQSGQLWR